MTRQKIIYTGEMMAINEFLFGSPEKTQQLATINPQQQQMQKQLLQMLQGNIGKSFDFAPIEQQARIGFQQRTIPSIMERFAGSNSNESSSAVPQMLGEAGKELDTGLAALRSQYGLQQQGNLANILGMAMHPAFENIHALRTPGFAENLASTAVPSAINTYTIIKLLPLLLSAFGPAGAAAGTAGSAAANLLLPK